MTRLHVHGPASALHVRSLRLVVFHFLFQGASIAAENAGPDLQLAQSAMPRVLDIRHGAITQQQGLVPLAQPFLLRLGLRLSAFFGVLFLALFRRQFARYDLDYHAVLVEDFITAGDGVGRHLVAHDHDAVGIAIPI